MIQLGLPVTTGGGGVGGGGAVLGVQLSVLSLRLVLLLVLLLGFLALELPLCHVVESGGSLLAFPLLKALLLSFLA